MTAEKGRPLPPRWAARFNTRGWRLGFGCRDVVLCFSMKRCRNEQFCRTPSREAAPSERPSCRLKAFLKCVQFTREHGSGLGARALACAPGTFNCAVNTERGSPCKGWAKKILPEEKRKVEIFLDQLAKPLQGAKRLLRQRGSEHRFPAHTLTIGTKTLCRSRNKKTKHLKSG